MPAFHSLVLPWGQNGTPGVPRLPGGRIQGLCKEGPKPPGGRIQKPALHRPGSPHSKKPSLISCAFPQFHPGSQLLRYCLPTKMGNPKSPHPEPDPAQVHPTARSVASNGVLPVQLHASVRLLSTALGPKRNAGCPTSARFWQIWEATTQTGRLARSLARCPTSARFSQMWEATTPIRPGWPGARPALVEWLSILRSGVARSARPIPRQHRLLNRACTSERPPGIAAGSYQGPTSRDRPERT
jgi:hypothetical protein